MSNAYAFQFKASGYVTPAPHRMSNEELADYITAYADTIEDDVSRYIKEAANRLTGLNRNRELGSPEVTTQ